MWFERFVIIATTLARDYVPSSWSYYSPSWVEIGIFVGTIGLFFTLYLLFTRVAPVVAIAEVKSILKSAGDQYTGPNAIHHHGDDNDLQAGQVTTHNVDEENETSINEMTDDVLTADSDVRVKSSAGVDDLKKIEGIGPKISDILNGGDIYTFAQLASADVNDLKQLLVNAGPAFQSHTPESWSEQAALARDGKWDELKELQDKLDGGKHV